MRILQSTPLVLIIVFLALPATAQVLNSKSYENALVVSADEYASEVGNEILQKGGNAVDAAVAIEFALAVTLPRAGNIGGGGFMVIRMADGKAAALDFREKAPQQAHRDMYLVNGKYKSELSRRGALASGVPGTVDGMIKALERYGRLPLDVVMEPAIRLAEQGYKLTYSQAQSLNAYKERLEEYESSKKYFTKGDTTLFKEGDLFVQKDLAQTLKRVARFGREGFYAGPVADAIVNEMRRNGGLITYEDLYNYESKWREPLKISYKNYDLIIMPPPSSGGIVVAQVLKMIEDYPIKQMGHNSAEYIHLLTEALRRSFADRAYHLGDPDFWEVPQQELISDDYNQQRMNTFDEDNATSSSSLAHGEIPIYEETTETTHFSIVDEEGNAVAVTTTLNGSFGSYLAVDGAGFMLNNEMDDFSAQPGKPNMFGLLGGEANAIAPGKRMLSSMTPTIVEKDDKLNMVLGAAGGPRIITATIQSFLNVAEFGMRAQLATSVPRIHHQWFPDVLQIDAFGLNADTEAILREKGHKIFELPTIGRAHNIFVDADGLLNSGVDPRGDGHASGY